MLCLQNFTEIVSFSRSQASLLSHKYCASIYKYEEVSSLKTCSKHYNYINVNYSSTIISPSTIKFISSQEQMIFHLKILYLIFLAFLSESFIIVSYRVVGRDLFEGSYFFSQFLYLFILIFNHPF